MTVVWIQKAETSFNDIVDYLLDVWTVELATDFIDIVEHTIGLIPEHPEMCKASGYYNKSREAFITRHTTMFYRVLNEKIEIKYFWGNFDDPEKIRNLLKFE